MRRFTLALLATAVVAVSMPAATRAADDYEGDSPGECSDRADNDRDGKFDCVDEGCANGPDCKIAEGAVAGQCSDRADNDRDGAFDCDDPDCAGSSDCGTKREARPSTDTREAMEELARLLRLTTCSYDGWSRAPKEVSVSPEGLRCRTIVPLLGIQQTTEICDSGAKLREVSVRDGYNYYKAVHCSPAKIYKQVSATTHWSEMDYVSVIRRFSYVTRPHEYWAGDAWEGSEGDYCVNIGRSRCLAITKDKAVADQIASFVNELGQVPPE